MATSTRPIRDSRRSASRNISASCSSSLAASDELRFEVLREVAPHRLAREQSVERAKGPVAGRIEFEHLLDTPTRRPRDGPTARRKSGHRAVERLALLHIVRLVDASLDDADEVLPALSSREELLERGEPVGVPWIDRQHLAVRLAARSTSPRRS
jgi:hypothetical protein